MKIALLSGAYKNAGDFLIERRMTELLQYALPDATIEKYLRNKIGENIEKINQADRVVFGGGPIYMKNLAPYLPVEQCIQELTAPVMVVGGGWYGNTDGNYLTYHYRFNDVTRRFLTKISQNGLGLGCRDFFTVKALKNEGLQNVCMTGCPAWYDTNCVHQLHLTKSSWGIQNILVSDPDRPANFDNALKLIQYLKSQFPQANITFVFHRGKQADDFTTEKRAALIQEFISKIEKLNVVIKDIAFGSEGFSLYDDCDLHVGFRVHAHIYNLSRRNRTVLIEEDGRGAGVNQALGLPSLKCYNDVVQISNELMFKVFRKSPWYPYTHLIDDLDNYLQVLEQTKDQYLLNAFALQEKYFETMVKFIKAEQLEV